MGKYNDVFAHFFVVKVNVVQQVSKTLFVASLMCFVYTTFHFA